MPGANKKFTWDHDSITKSRNQPDTVIGQFYGGDEKVPSFIKESIKPQLDFDALQMTPEEQEEAAKKAAANGAGQGTGSDRTRGQSSQTQGSSDDLPIMAGGRPEVKEKVKKKKLWFFCCS
mmetsp:Transcript_919/g.1066  ORF Transcript_919/g.1066 Transcript_919/m.1066 type:complete len:121 (-) Transcript_919:110-472(-)|eukprot:CAMPEP_0205831600 /NCGR_PEP_ID=MMETSP0206-20130828/44508_1 /ASSEMBLY_ACC=CAM_ASM_000279 /TAXON_ID=36767 /ORGANISM="Euplotes focardii, Strain TN1" /LENGTH=120 /DNA_ID=CAMNT_0053136379 /DNA_START=129 /DNA_END=491 /DNA_ORIENTATION=+